MCGLVCVRSRKPIAQEHHLGALDLLAPRGPDCQTWRHQDDIFIGQTVLNFNGDREFYQSQPNGQFFVFNGEIYGQTADTRAVGLKVTAKDWTGLADLQGPWAWIWTDFKQILWSTDPQHEKHLFVYQDQDWLIVTSEMQVILHYLQPTKIIYDAPVKHLPVFDRMPWTGCSRARPGRLYRDGKELAVIDDISLWPRETYGYSYARAVDDLDRLLGEVTAQMVPDQVHALTLSGGIDSGILQTYLPRATTCIALLDKDPVCRQVMADQAVEVDARTWARSFRTVADRLHLPIMTWSMITLHALLEHVPARAIFMGSAADEIFGGYPYNLTQERSPYSGQLLATLDPLLADYMVQAGGVDMMGYDLVAGLLGKEIRLPFAHPRVIRFALSLPRHYKVQNRTKAILRDLYRERVGTAYEFAKQGFTGHCNDSIPYLDSHFHTDTTDRLRAWREFVLHWFQQQAYQ